MQLEHTHYPYNKIILNFFLQKCKLIFVKTNSNFIVSRNVNPAMFPSGVRNTTKLRHITKL